jgi:hypothetical protein
MKLSVAGKVALQALTMLGSYSLVKAQTCTNDATFVCGVEAVCYSRWELLQTVEDRKGLAAEY